MACLSFFVLQVLMPCKVCHLSGPDPSALCKADSLALKRQLIYSGFATAAFVADFQPRLVVRERGFFIVGPARVAGLFVTVAKRLASGGDCGRWRGHPSGPPLWPDPAV